MPGIGIVRSLAFTKVATYCSQYNAVYKKLVELDDVPDTLIAAEQNKMVRQNVAYVGWADVYDIKYVLAQQYNNNGGALINWINPGTHDAVEVANGGVLTFTSLEGLKGDGNAYLNLNYNPYADGVNYTLTSVGICYYTRQWVPDTGIVTGCGDGTNYVGVQHKNVAGTATLRINNIMALYYAYANGIGGTGFIEGIRDSGTLRIRVNTTSLGGMSKATSALPNADAFLFARNNNGTPEAFSEDQISSLSYGGLLTDAKELASMNIIETYMDSNGKGIIS